MSRLIVKNLPSETSEQDLHRLFSQRGTITEIDLKRNSQGRSRHFAFVGFHDQNDAQEAIRNLNHTFINMNKIKVQKCLNLSSGRKPRQPNNKRARRTEKVIALKKKVASSKKVAQPKKVGAPKSRSDEVGLGTTPLCREILVEKYRKDPEFAAYLDLKSPEQAAKVRRLLSLPQKEDNSIDPNLNFDIPEKPQKLKRREILNLMYYVKVKNFPRRTNKTKIREFFHPLDCKIVRFPKRSFGVAYVAFMNERERREALNKDKSYLGGEQVRVLEYNDDPKKRRITDIGLPSFRIFFFNVPARYTLQDVEKTFSSFGKLKSIVMPRYSSTEALKGYGLVTYENKLDAERAFTELERDPLWNDKIVLSPEQTPKVPTEKLEDCLRELGEAVQHNENSDCSDEDYEPKKKKWKNQEESLKNEESVAESGRIFLRNLSYTTQEADIEKLFGTYGPITEINLPIDSNTKQLKGFGIVTYLMPEHAVKAFNDLDGTILHGRMLHLIPGKSKDTPDLEESSNFKENKLNKLKAQAGKAHNWNALFVDHNAVAEVVAEKFGTSKESILGPQIKGSAAVRLALAETQIVNETKKYLEEMGVRLDAFNQSTNIKRSKTTLLVKNLPSKTEAKELKQIFEKHGQIGRLIFPPNGLTAIIEFLDPSEARKAFTSLAYSKFKHLPLYLEWAPEGTFDSGNTKPNLMDEKELVKESTGDDHTVTQQNESAVKNEVDGNVEKSDRNKEVQTKSTEKVVGGDPESGTTLFVKNLNFQTRNEALRQHFEQIGPLHYAYVVTKKADRSKDLPELSKGFGFVRYMLRKDADRALEQLQMSILDEKSLELARSDRAERDDVEKQTPNKNKQSKDKLIVKNIPFAAKKNEVEQIFSTFGGLKRLKLPKKVGDESHRHRGFAFVEFTNESDAKAAFEALHLSTHLLGRRLVLEWAKDDENIDEIRKKTEEHYAPQKKAESKKSVFKID